jgi:hypothetical protein
MAKTINRVDLLKDGTVYVEFEATSVLDGGRQMKDGDKKVRNVPAHDDLTNAFIKLIPHLMFGCHFYVPNHLNDEDWFEGHEYLDDERYEGISVTGVTMVGKDRQGVKLIGRKTTPHGDVVSINSPILYFSAESPKPYILHKLLKQHVDNLLAEGDAYLKGKFAPHFVQETMNV